MTSTPRPFSADGSRSTRLSISDIFPPIFPIDYVTVRDLALIIIALGKFHARDRDISANLADYQVNADASSLNSIVDG